MFRAPESHWWLVSLCCSLFLEGGACLLMGAAFPFLAAVSVRAGVAGQGSGRLYALNALAGVVGSFAVAYVLIPQLGVDRAFGALAVLAVSTAAIVAFLATPSPRVRALGLGVAAVTLGILVAEPADQLRRSFLGGPAPDFVREGTTTSVAVVSHGSFGSTTWRELRTPGTTMSDTRFSARRYMGLMAHLPLMLAAEHDSAVLVCFGVGNTARSLLSHPDLAHLEVVDISPEVLSASPYFAAVTGGVDPLLDPRTHVTVDDGRHHLLTTAATYDVVTSEPPPPNHAGVVNLYSREYYRAARRVLRPGGVVAQWLPVMQLSEDDILAMIGAMASELPYVELRYGFGYEWILLGSDRRPAPDADEQRRRVAFPSVVRDLASIGVRDFGDLTGTLLQDDAPLRALGELAPPVTDDLPSIEYPIAAVLRPPRLPAGLADPPSPVVALVLRALPLRGVGSAEMQELALGSTLRAALRLAPAHPALLALLDVDDISRDAAAAWLAQHPDDARAAFVLARRAFYEADFATAEARLAAIAADAPGAGVPVAAYWFLRAECARALGRADDAQAAAARAFAASGDPGFKAALAGAPRSSP